MKAKTGNDLLTNSQADQVTDTINVPGYLSQIIIVSWKNTDNLSWQQTEITGKKKPALFWESEENRSWQLVTMEDTQKENVNRNIEQRHSHK